MRRGSRPHQRSGFSGDRQLVIHWWCSTVQEAGLRGEAAGGLLAGLSLSGEFAGDAVWNPFEPAADEQPSARLDLEFLRSVGVKPC